MKNWLRAEKELNYRIKQEANNLINKGYNWQVSVEKAKNIVKSEIEFRAYLICCATKDNTLDNWLKAESDFIKGQRFAVIAKSMPKSCYKKRTIN